VQAVGEVYLYHSTAAVAQTGIGWCHCVWEIVIGVVVVEMAAARLPMPNWTCSRISNQRGHGQKHPPSHVSARRRRLRYDDSTLNTFFHIFINHQISAIYTIPGDVILFSKKPLL